MKILQSIAGYSVAISLVTIAICQVMTYNNIFNDDIPECIQEEVYSYAQESSRPDRPGA